MKTFLNNNDSGNWLGRPVAKAVYRVCEDLLTEFDDIIVLMIIISMLTYWFFILGTENHCKIKRPCVHCEYSAPLLCNNDTCCSAGCSKDCCK